MLIWLNKLNIQELKHHNKHCTIRWGFNFLSPYKQPHIFIWKFHSKSWVHLICGNVWKWSPKIFLMFELLNLGIANMKSTWLKVAHARQINIIKVWPNVWHVASFNLWMCIKLWHKMSSLSTFKQVGNNRVWAPDLNGRSLVKVLL